MEKISANKIIEREVIGNNVLYNMCKDYPLNTNAEQVSAKTWLIGRSYAASPQRRKIPGQQQNDNYSYFFIDLANIFIQDKRSREIDETLENLKSIKYFGNLDQDENNILSVLELVNKLNSTIVDSIKILDNYQEGDKDPNQNISFCSKYLHFHCPNMVFIYDSYSSKNAYSYIKNLKCTLKNQLGINIDKIIQYYISKIGNEKLDVYIAHFIRCYIISTKCFDTQISPRQVDTALLTGLCK